MHACPRQAAVVRVREDHCCVLFDLSELTDVSLPAVLRDVWDGA